MYENIVSFVAKGTNSGKTYIIEQVIEELKKRGKKVAAVKHSMHLPYVDKAGTDTYKFAQKGADRVIIFSDNALVFYEMACPDIDYLTFIASRDVDIVIVEGFKTGPFKKIEVFNKTLYGNPMCLEEPREEFIAIISDEYVDAGIEHFTFDDISGICTFVEKQTAGSIV